MDPNDPNIAEDKRSDEERLEYERQLRELGLRPSGLGESDLNDIEEDLNSDRDYNDEEDRDDGLSDVVPPEEYDGND